MVEQLKELKAGKAIRCPVYSYADHQRTNETELIRPSKVVIVEGILIFQDPRLREMLDIKIFVETDADVRILRRALRDVRDRGRTLESVITQYLRPSSPCTRLLWNPASATPISSSPMAVKTAPPSRCWPTISAA